MGVGGENPWAGCRTGPEAGHGWSWRPAASGPALLGSELGGARAWGQTGLWGGHAPSPDTMPNPPSPVSPPWPWETVLCTLWQLSLPLPRSEKQRWISALCPSSSQEDKEFFSEGQGSSLPPGPHPPGVGSLTALPLSSHPGALLLAEPAGRETSQPGAIGGCRADPWKSSDICLSQAGPPRHRHRLPSAQAAPDGKAFCVLPFHPRTSPSYPLENSGSERLK